MNPVSPLTAHLGYWLRLVSNHVSTTFTRRLAERDVSVVEWVILRALYDRAEMSPAELAGLLGMSRGAISKIEDRLAARALLLRRPDDTDRRSHRLRLSVEGRALVPQLSALADANDEACFGGLDEADRVQLARILHVLAAQLDLTHPPLT